MNSSEKAIVATNFIKTLFIVFALAVVMFAMQAKDSADNDFYECEKKSGVGRCEK